MDWKMVIFQTLGGLGLFLMGMKTMSEGMQKVAGEKLRKVLGILTANRFVAVFVGFVVTAVIQSSSATTVMTVGFVNATLMNLQQAIGVVLGANIGTTVTGWIVTLKIVKFAMPLIGVGVLIRFFSKKDQWRYFGEIVFGFGILFLGMQTMKNGFAPLRESEDFIHFFTLVDGSSFLSILLGVCVGTLTTVAVQSSSATIGITIALASQGLLNFEGAVALILGDNIGTTITAILASIGANHHAKRAALAHTLFNTLGVLIMLVVFVPFTSLIDHLVPGDANFMVNSAAEAAKYGGKIGSMPYIGQHIAMAHSLFNITNVLIFIPLVPFLARLCEKIIREPKQKETIKAVQFSHINYNLISTPSLGIAESEKELIVMAEMVRKNAQLVHRIDMEKDDVPAICDKVLADERVIDEYKKMISEFLLTLSSKSMSREDAVLVGGYMEFAHSLEKYADFIENISKLYDRISRKGLKVSQNARNAINTIVEENCSFYDETIALFKGGVSGDSFMENAESKKRRIKKMVKDAKLDHFERVRTNACNNDASVFYIDILNQLSGMCSQTFNLAEVATGTKYETV